MCKRDERREESTSGDWDNFSEGAGVTYDPGSWSSVQAVSRRSDWRRYGFRMDLACVEQGTFDLVLEGVFAEKRVSFCRCVRVRIAVFSCVISRVKFVSRNKFESEKKRHKFDSRELKKPCKSAIHKALKVRGMRLAPLISSGCSYPRPSFRYRGMGFFICPLCRASSARYQIKKPS